MVIHSRVLILKLGTDPVSCEITNGSQNHDEYLLGLIALGGDALKDTEDIYSE
jgi:hypothetical protein